MPLISPIVIEDGHVHLGGRPILRGVQLRVEAGEALAVLGANGSGKSTLLKTILGLRPLTHGRVDLFGTPVSRFRAWHRLGYVPQRSPMATGIAATAAEVVASGRLARRRLLLPAGRADRRAVAEALDAVGLAERASHPVTTLSGGQQQRVLIARALAGEPEVLLMDEPNAGVDIVSQRAIAATLQRLHDEGSTLIMVLHELGPLRPLISRAIIVREGRIDYEGPPDPTYVSPTPPNLVTDEQPATLLDGRSGT